MQYLDTVLFADNTGYARPVLDLIGQLLPASSPSLELVARQLGLHPRTLQRRLAAEGSSFAGLVDQARRERAERYLRETDMPLAQLSRALGYAEQSVLIRACQRWFGCGPSAYPVNAATI